MGKTSDLPGIVAHEYVHTLQRESLGSLWGYAEHRLLLQSIREGAADFVAEAVTGRRINQAVHAYGERHEAELWAAFQKEMYGNVLSGWLYQGGNAMGEAPADLGYYIGYKICEAYYQRAEDKAGALQRIVRIGNHRRFLRKSGYGGAW